MLGFILIFQWRASVTSSATQPPRNVKKYNIADHKTNIGLYKKVEIAASRINRHYLLFFKEYPKYKLKLSESHMKPFFKIASHITAIVRADVENKKFVFLGGKSHDFLSKIRKDPIHSSGKYQKWFVTELVKNTLKKDQHISEKMILETMSKHYRELYNKFVPE